MIRATDDLADIVGAYYAALRPDPLVTVSQWASAERVMVKPTPFPGRWTNARAPYLTEPMDRLSPHDPCQRVVLMFASQLGKTEVLLNWLGTIIRHYPTTFLAFQPTTAQAKRFTKLRIDPMVKAIPSLAERVAPSKSRDESNTGQMKTILNGALFIMGANAPGDLASIPGGAAACDEVDRYPTDVGARRREDGSVEGEGDVLDLVEQRLAAFPDAKLLLTSTPTIKGVSRIERAYEQTDQRQFWVPCPECDGYQVLVWAQVRWPNGQPELARYECEHCGCLLEDRAKVYMLPRGEWRPSRHDAPAGYHGYHISALYQPHGWATPWPRLAQLFREARHEPQRLKTFINTKLAEPWDALGQTVVSAEAAEKRGVGEWGVWRDDKGVEHDDPIPDDVLVVSVGIDVQDNRVEFEVVGWDANRRSWSLDYRVIDGDPGGEQLWSEVDVALWGLSDLVTQSGHPVRHVATCVDTGGHHTEQVCAFVRARKFRRVWGIKGVPGPHPVWPSTPNRKNKYKIDLYLVGVDSAKEQFYSRLRIEDPDTPGYCAFPRGRSDEYYKGLTCERMDTKMRNGRRVIFWRTPVKARNEPLDCRVYATAALEGYLATGAKLARHKARRAGSGGQMSIPDLDTRQPDAQATSKSGPGADGASGGRGWVPDVGDGWW